MVLAFEDLRLDIERRDGEPVDLVPKAFDLLAFLVEQRDRMVSKNDLLQAVWEGRIVSKGALTTRISAVRRALGDDGSTQRLIRWLVRADGAVDHARPGQRFRARNPRPRGRGAAQGRRPGGVRRCRQPPARLLTLDLFSGLTAAAPPR